MDSARAYEILKITPPFDTKQLKKHYYKAALRYHPDKNNGVDSKDRFQDVQNAYKYLCATIDDNKANLDDNSYTSIIHNFFRSCQVRNNDTNQDNENVISILFTLLVNGCRSISLKAFEGIDKQNAIEIYGFIATYADLFGFDNCVIESIREIIKAKFNNDEIIILNPSMENLLNAEVYKLNHNGELFYVPLWHHEITYELSDSSLIVRCVPKIEDHISIDENNTIHISVCISTTKILETGFCDVIIGTKNFRIHGSDIKLCSKQVFKLCKQGIPTINTHDIYNEKLRSDVILHITLNK